jgi:hypothetical protein
VVVGSLLFCGMAVAAWPALLATCLAWVTLAAWRNLRLLRLIGRRGDRQAELRA